MGREVLFRGSEELMKSAGFKLSPEEENLLNTAASWPNVWATVTSTLYSSKLLERSNRKLEESNDRHANRMTWLTVALAVFAAIEAVATTVSVLVAAGAIGRCAP
jgi:hypothetical protein